MLGSSWFKKCCMLGIELQHNSASQLLCRQPTNKQHTSMLRGLTPVSAPPSSLQASGGLCGVLTAGIDQPTSLNNREAKRQRTSQQLAGLGDVGGDHGCQRQQVLLQRVGNTCSETTLGGRS